MRQIVSGGKQSREDNDSAKRLPGRPRSEHSRQAILRSTLKLIQHAGFPELTIEAIAADAGVGKATVYRWWPNKGALVVDAFAASAEHKLHFPDTGSVYRDMSLQMKQVIAIFRGPRGRTVAALLGGGQSDPELLEAFRERFLWPRRREAYKTLLRGIERGELPRNLDLDLVLDILYGAIYMRFLIRHDELSESYVEEVCRLVLGGAAGNRVKTRATRGKVRMPEATGPFVSAAGRRILERTEW
jgi:AcrR family transcriptional regulator